MKNIHIENQLTTFAKMIMGAGHSIKFILRSGAGILNYNNIDNIHSLPDSRIERKCILTDPEYIGYGAENSYNKEAHNEIVKNLIDFGWDIRVVKRKPSINCLIIDDEEVLLANLTKEPEHHYHLTSESAKLRMISEHFSRLWGGYETLDIVYEDLLSSTIPDIANTIISASNERWNEIIKYLSVHPEEMYSMAPRNFEILIAELLTKEGMDVELTESQNDGGRDILAWTETQAGKHLYLVECKRYAKKRPIGVNIVRNLYGVVESEKATGGIIVTTSDFTRGAKEFQELNKNRIWLKNHQKVKDWLNKGINI